MKGLVDKLYKCFAIIIIFILLSLWFSSEAYASDTVYYDGWSDQFTVTITYVVDNCHDDVDNYIGVYYYMPGNGCYYTSNYSYVEYINRAAKEKGTITKTINLQGPPCMITMSVYGSAMDHTQYYIKSVKVEPIHPRKTSLPTEFDLWTGTFGCSVATMFTNAIACDLHLDKGKPQFTGWYDPYTYRDAVFGDDKIMQTATYYTRGCNAPYIYTKDLNGVSCDQYGVAWPIYEPKLSSSPKIKSKSGRKVTIEWKKFRKKLKNVLSKTKWVEVQYGTNSKFKKAKIKKIKKEDLKKKTVIKHLKANKKYYFRVRLSNGKKPISNWSKKIKIKIKK